MTGSLSEQRRKRAEHERDALRAERDAAVERAEKAERELRELARVGDTLSPQEIINHCASGLGVDRHDYPGDPEIRHRSVIELMGQLRSIDGVLARRPALADCDNRVDKISKAIRVAGESDALRAELAAAVERLRVTGNNNAMLNSDIVSFRAEVAALTAERDALAGKTNQNEYIVSLTADNKRLRAAYKRALRAALAPREGT